MLYMIFQYGRKTVLIHRILNLFQSHTGNDYVLVGTENVIVGWKDKDGVVRNVQKISVKECSRSALVRIINKAILSIISTSKTYEDVKGFN